MKTYRFAIIALLLLGSGPTLALSQQDEGWIGIKKDVAEIKQSQKTIETELAGIKKALDQLLTRPAAPALPPAPKHPTVSIDNDPYRGDANAPLTLIEFSDYQCPFCGRHAQETLPKIEAEYIKTGKVKYVFRDFPLSFHKQAMKAAQAAHCAGEQGKYWEMHDRFFGDQKVLALGDFSTDVKALGLNATPFETCLNSDKYQSEVEKDMADGKQAGVTGTPGFFLGRTEPGSPLIKDTTVLVGAQPYANFKAALDALLSAPLAPAP